MTPTVSDAILSGSRQIISATPDVAEAELSGDLPATLRWTITQPYLIAKKGDTFEGVVRHLSTWTNGWFSNRSGKQEAILEKWQKDLRKLNPQLPKGQIPKGTRIHLPE